MSLDFQDIPQGGGGFLKPADETGGAVYLIEVERFEPQRPSQFGPKDTAFATLTVFDDEESLDAAEPTSIRPGVGIDKTVLARDLKPLVGKATIVTLTQVAPSKAGQHPAWVWRATSKGVKAKVMAYAEKREAEEKAAIADAPGFDD